MSAIRVARGFTKRDVIVKFEGCYHGHADHLLVKAGSGLATFGVPTQLAQGGSAGEMAQVQFDAPSFYLDNKGTFYHTDADTPDTIPASGLRNVVQAFAKIYDDVNALDLKDVQPPPSERPAAAAPSTR